MLETGYAATVALWVFEAFPGLVQRGARTVPCLDRDESGIAKAAQQAQEAALRGITAFIW
jgi:hypothetical protein